jgi:hypothetical protein
MLGTQVRNPFVVGHPSAIRRRAELKVLIREAQYHWDALSRNHGNGMIVAAST